MRGKGDFANVAVTVSAVQRQQCHGQQWVPHWITWRMQPSHILPKRVRRTNTGIARIFCPDLARIVPNAEMTWLEEVVAIPDSWILQP